MSELYYAAFLDSEFPEEFGKNWPLHITLLSRFILNSEVADEIAGRVSQMIPPIDVAIGKQTYFGIAKDKPGREIKPNPALTTLHYSLLVHTEEAGAKIVKARNSGKNYVPHIPVLAKRSSLLPKQLTVANFSLVERHKKGRRRVLDTYELTGKNHG